MIILAPEIVIRPKAKEYASVPDRLLDGAVA